jgi:hypothetical protein
VTDAIRHGGRCRGHARGYALARSTVTRLWLAGQQPHHQSLRLGRQRFVLVDEFTRDEPDLLAAAPWVRLGAVDRRMYNFIEWVKAQDDF